MTAAIDATTLLADADNALIAWATDFLTNLQIGDPTND